ncbi:MAG: histidine phosphatase family protein [Nitrospinae bacterium]|nr:histidine phosphatase family protein [Nitrospinota bacterium]
MDKGQTKIFLIRHGEVANAVDRCYNGHYDIDLSTEGLRQIERIADRLENEPIKAVYSSDLLRTIKGARIIAERHSLEAISLKELRELNYGIWEGKRVDDIKRLYPDDVEARYSDIVNFRIRGGETLREMRERVLLGIEGIIHNHRGESVVVVAHGGVNRIIIVWSLDMDLKNFFRIKQDYAALNIISFYNNEKAIVELMNG